MSSVATLLLRRTLSSLEDLDKAQALVTKAGLFGHGRLVASLISWASLSPRGCLARARSIFEETAMDDPLLCNAMVRAYAVSVFPAMALRVFNDMLRLGIESDGFALSFALRACSRALKWSQREEFSEEVKRKGFEIHCRALKLGFGGDRCVVDSLLVVYSKCGGRLGLARQLFDEMSKRSVGAWNVMISAYDRAGDYESADRLFGSMPMKGVVAWNTLLSRYARSGNMEFARKVFEEMPVRDSVSWNSIISGYVWANDYDEALRLFRKMEVSGVETTEVTLVSVLGACAETGLLEIGRKIHESLKVRRIKTEGYLGNAIVDMYAKCGELNSALEVFNELKVRPSSCWNAMIVGFAVHGRAEEALDLFSEMERRSNEVSPNQVTFIGVLTACSHKGLVEEGRRFFNRMTKHYRINPDKKHYGCVVDLFTRWGCLDEAYELIETVEPLISSVLWRTLLGACVAHGNVNLGEKCYRKLDDLGSLKDSDYVLLSNVYAETERWDDVERIRNDMVRNRVVKVLGHSCYKDVETK